jgi:hypothetical protein
MIYIGFVIPIEEALRLLKLPDDYVKSFYDTGPIQTYLKANDCSIVFHYIDKGACLFGVEVKIREESSVEDTIIAMIIAKKLFLHEMKNAGIDSSKVNLTRVEEDSWTVENPEPYVIIC